jgi:drug/metabolite transporter (DMT)-like permease
LADATDAALPAPRRLAAWAPLAAAVGWGASVPFSKLWLEGAPRLFAAGWVYLSSGVGLFLFRRLSPVRGLPLSRSDVPALALAILFGAVLAPFALFTGLARAPASLSSLLLNLEIVFTAAIAVLWFHERLDRRHTLGTALVVLGSAGTFLTEQASGDDQGGGLWIVAACLCWAVDNNVTRRISAKDPVAIAAWKGLVGGAVSLAACLALGQALPSGSAPWLGGAAIGLVAYGVSLSLFVLGLRSVGAARTVALFGVHPFVGLLASAVVLGEPLTPLVLGLAAILAVGVALLVGESRARGGPSAGPPGVA